MARINQFNASRVTRAQQNIERPFQINEFAGSVAKRRRMRLSLILVRGVTLIAFAALLAFNA